MNLPKRWDTKMEKKKILDAMIYICMFICVAICPFVIAINEHKIKMTLIAIQFIFFVIEMICIKIQRMKINER